jgi:hypothetical protein
MNTRRALVWLIMLGPLIAGPLNHALHARAGGGGGFAGGGDSFAGGDGGGAGALVYIVLRLVLVLWHAGPGGKVASIVLVGGGIGLWVWRSRHNKRAQQERERQGRVLQSQGVQRRQSQGTRALREVDPNFSRVLFLDFAHLVYVKYHESRGGLARRGDDFAVAPYLAPRLREGVKQADTRVEEVLVGAIHLATVRIDRQFAFVPVEYRANVVENGRRRYLRQRLYFRRPREVLTRPPERLLALGCPSCGSKEEPGLDGRCPRCGTATGAGQTDWQVQRVEILEHREVETPPWEGGPEKGTNEATIVSPELHAGKRALESRDETFQWDAFNRRLRHMFYEIQKGWSELDEGKLRPYETDRIFHAHRFWLERYRARGVRNRIENVMVTKLETAAIEHDAYFDAITVRVWASMRDWHEDNRGRVVSGSPSETRRFSEYWTLVRRSDVAHRATGDPRLCPQCGAPLDRVNMAGLCEYCGSKIISGEFDWVLALIEQDEEYRG